MRIESGEARGRIWAGEGEEESVGGVGGLDGCGVGRRVGDLIVPGDEGALCGRFPDWVGELSIDTRQILFGGVNEVEGRGFDVRGEIFGLEEEACEALCVPEDAILGLFVRGSFLPGLIEERVHLLDGFGWVGDAEDIFVGAIIIGPGACPALFLESEEAAHGGGGWAEHVAAEGVVDGVDVGVWVPEDAEVEVGVE